MSFVELVAKVFDAVPMGRGLEEFGIEVEVDQALEKPESPEQIRSLLGDCKRCKLCEGRKNIVFGSGKEARPDLMVIGEAPGEKEDETGEPFVGKAGEMLDKMLENVLGISRKDVYVTNAVKCRPPENRNPEPEEVESCIQFAKWQKEAVKPKVVVIFGRVAMEAIFGLSGGVRANRTKWIDWDGTPTMITYHPAYLLRNPDDKRKALEDLRLVDGLLKQDRAAEKQAKE